MVSLEGLERSVNLAEACVRSCLFLEISVALRPSHLEDIVWESPELDTLLGERDQRLWVRGVVLAEAC